MLASEGIDSNKLMPRHPDPYHPQTIEQGNDPLFPIYLPLKVSIASPEGQWSGGCMISAEGPNQKGGPMTITSAYLQQGNCIIGAP